MSRGNKQRMRWLAIVVGLLVATTSWGANRLDIFTEDRGDVDNPFDDWDPITHPFISEDLQPWQVYLYVDGNFNAIDPAVNLNAVSTWEILHAVEKSCEAWNNVPISSFEFDEAVVPFDHTFAKFPNQMLTPGATGLDGWNLVTFQDPTQAPLPGVLGMSVSWMFFRDFELGSFLELPPGIIIEDSFPPGQGPPVVAQIDFNLDGITDVILEARDYAAGETIEGDTWLNQIEAWHQWPDDPNDLPTTPGGTTPYPDTIGTLDIEGTVTHEFGHLIGIGHANLERATMYYLLKGPYDEGYLYPTDVWDMRELDLDDEIGAALIYPAGGAGRGTIAGRVLDGRNFDGLSDREQGVIDPVLYGTLYVCRWMSQDKIPAYVPDRLLYYTTPGVVIQQPTQQDFDTSPGLWMELLTEVQTGDDIRIALWPNAVSLNWNGTYVDQFGVTRQFGAEAVADYVIPGLPPYDKYILWLDNSGVYYNDSAGVPTNNISFPFDFFFGYQPIPTEFYGGVLSRDEQRLLGMDSSEPPTVLTTTPLQMKGDDPTSYLYVAVRAGAVTGGIDIYTNAGGLPPGVTPTPIADAEPTPAPIGNTRFPADIFGDSLLPTETEWGVDAAVGDVDNDGDIDVYICNAVSGETTGSEIAIANRLLINTLVMRTGDGTLVRDPSGPKLVDMTFGEDGIQGSADDRLPYDLDMSYGAKMADFNLDGYLDIYVSNSESVSQDNSTAAQNRLYLNRGGENPARAGHFRDVTDALRTDPGTGIPHWYTPTVLPGVLNRGPFNSSDRSTKSDVGDLDSDGDIDIVVSNYSSHYAPPVWCLVFDYDDGDYVEDEFALFDYISERILINHANDLDPDTRGFYFTDETLGMDGLYAGAIDQAEFGELIPGSRICADRLPPPYPEFVEQTGTELDPSGTYEVIVAPIIGDGSLDIFVVNHITNLVTNKDGTEMLYENADVDGDGIADGYFRLVNYGWEFGALSTYIDIFGTTTTAFFGDTYSVGIPGISIEQSDPGDWEPDGMPEINLIDIVEDDSFGAGVGDLNYQGYPMILCFHGTDGHTIYDFPGDMGPGECMRGGDPWDYGVFAGFGLMYHDEGDWGAGTIYGYDGGATVYDPHPQYHRSSTIPTTPSALGYVSNLARDAAVADFDNDGDLDIYVVYSKDRPENVLGGVGPPNEYFINDGFTNLTNMSLIATSGTRRGTYSAIPLDVDLDGDLDILQINASGQNTVLLNTLYIAPPDTTDPYDNPMFYDATPQFLPPYFTGSTAPPFAAGLANMTVNTAAADLNGDDLADLVMACGAIFTATGDSSLLLMNHGTQATAATPVFTPADATYPPPRIVGYPTLAMEQGLPLDVWNRYFVDYEEVSYDVVCVDLDLDADYDVFYSTLGTGPVAFSNEDSDDLLRFPFTGLGWSRFFNTVRDADFQGDGILVLARADTPIRVPRLMDPGGFNPGQQKKEQNRRIAYADVDSNGAIDLIIANGIPAVGAPNALLLNGVGGDPAGWLSDATETHLPTHTMTYVNGGVVNTYDEGENDDTADVAAADFDSDGYPELIFLNIETAATSSTRFLDNAGDGHFVDTRVPGSPNASWLFPSFRGRYPSTLCVADFDHKGDPTEDINGNGVLDSGEDINHNGVLDWWDTTETEDINGNGVLDPTEDGLIGPRNGVLDTVDLNGDGEITPRQPGVFDASWDLFIAFRDGPDKLYLNTLPGPPGTPFALVDVTATHLPQIYRSSYGTDCGDVDLDGDIDIVVAIEITPQEPHVDLLLNDGMGHFQFASEEVPSNYSVLQPFYDWFHEICYDVDLFDVDADGDLDMHLAFIGVHSVAMTGGALNALFVNRTVGDNFNTVNRFRTYKSPYVVRLSPRAAYQGSALMAAIFGQNLDGGISVLDLGPGISVGSISRVGPNVFTAPLQIAEDAPAGPRDAIVVVNGGEMAQLHGAFTVLMRPTSARAAWRLYP